MWGQLRQPSLKPLDQRDELYMAEALSLAQRAYDQGEVPVGAVIVRDHAVIGRGWNQPIRLCDASAHAEILALRDAGSHCQNYRLPGATLYVTIEPCTMCVGALLHARIERIVFAATEPKAGALVSQLQLLQHQHWNHSLTFTGGVMEAEASELMQSFFKMRREQRRQQKQAKPAL